MSNLFHVLKLCLTYVVVVTVCTRMNSVNAQSQSAKKNDSPAVAVPESTLTPAIPTPVSVSPKVPTQSTEAQAETKRAKSSGEQGGVATKAANASNNLRLPRYYSGLVDQAQRAQILEIQLQYRTRISELEEELSRLRADESQALEKVLTESQRKLLDRKRTQASNRSAVKSKSDDPSM